MNAHIIDRHELNKLLHNILHLFWDDAATDNAKMTPKVYKSPFVRTLDIFYELF